jgi:hypothetical protein
LTSEEKAIAAIDALNQLGISYMVTGSFASNSHGIARSTNDIDLVVEASGFSAAKVASLLGDEFQLDQQVYFETITGTTRFVIRHRDSPFVIEFFLLSDDAHDRCRFDRRMEAAILGKRTNIATAEDVIIAKLRWSQRGRRPTDRDDAKNVIAVQGDRLDWPYIRKWCREHGTLELLEEIRFEVLGR